MRREGARVSVGASAQGPGWGCGVHSFVGSTRTQAGVGGCTSSDLLCILLLQPKAMLYLLPPHLQGEGNGSPLQHSCLENPMDGGTWWAAVHGVAKSQHLVLFKD